MSPLSDHQRRSPWIFSALIALCALAACTKSECPEGYECQPAEEVADTGGLTADDGGDGGDGGDEDPPEEPEWEEEEEEEDCDSHYAQLCYDGDVYWYDSCGNREDREDACASDEYCDQVSTLDAECVEEEEDCTERAASTCVGDDVYWQDSCGQTGDLKDSCEDACLESGGEATCVTASFRCWDEDHDCYSSSEILSLDIDCEVRVDADATLTLSYFEIYSRYSTDAADIDDWDDADWSGSTSLSPGSWTDVADTFNVDFDDDPSDEELELEATLTVAYGSDSVTFSEVDADASMTVDVDEDWFCW